MGKTGWNAQNLTERVRPDKRKDRCSARIPDTGKPDNWNFYLFWPITAAPIAPVT